MNDAVALITGASRGIGRATALALARAGAHVIITARTQDALESLDDAIRAEGGQATLVPLDLRDGTGVDRLGAGIFKRWGRLDMLIGNAGVLGGLSPVAHITPEDWEATLGVNLTANWRLIRSVEALLHRAPAPRAVFLTSNSDTPRAFWSAYAASKTALNALVLTWARECKETSLRVNLFDPGAVATALRDKAMPGEDKTKLASPEAIAEALLPLLAESCTHHGEIIRYDL